jgi:hypothetical protein
VKRTQLSLRLRTGAALPQEKLDTATLVIYDTDKLIFE